MNKKVALGPGAASLILVVLVLVLTMLAVTTMSAAGNDEKLSLRSAEMLTEVYTLQDAAEQSLMRLDAALANGKDLPEGMAREGDQVLWTEQVGNRLLELGEIQGRDMTSEAAMTKLMWAIGQGMSQKEIAKLFTLCLAGEVTAG